MVSTLAGSTQGNTDGTGTSAQFNYPRGVAVDGAGNVYVADEYNHRIRKITASGVVSTLAGSASGYTDGTGTSAKFKNPYGVAVDGAGNVYVADRSNHRIRKITTSGVVSTLAGSSQGYTDGTGTSAQFYYPSGVAVDSAGNVYVADKDNHRIRKITTSGVVSTLAGSGTSGYADGTGTSAKFNYPFGVAVDGAGNVYVADYVNHRIRKIGQATCTTPTTPSLSASPDSICNGNSSTLTVSGSKNAASTWKVYSGGCGTGLVDSITGTGTTLSVSPTSTTNYYVREEGCVTAGSCGTTVVTVTAASYNTITVTVCDTYTSPSGRHTWFVTGIYKDTIPNAAGCDSILTINLTVIATPIVTVSTLAGSTYGYTDGTGTSAKFYNPTGVAVDGAGNVYVADRYNHRIRKITTSGVVSTLAGSGTSGNADGTGTSAQFSYPSGVAVDSAGNVFVADRNNHRIRKITASGVVSTLAGSTQGYTDGTGTSAKFDSPTGVAVDGAGNVYVADLYNHRIRKITASGVVSTLAGSASGYTDGTGTSAKFKNPTGVAVDGAGNVYVADYNNHGIRKITTSGVVSTLAGIAYGYTDGTGTSAKFKNPYGVAVDGAGNVYVADRDNHRIRKITTSGVVSTLAGSSQGYTDGTGTSAQFAYPFGVAVDGTGNVYVADESNHRIRKITLSAGSAETTETITANVCDTYTSPSGRHTWFVTGIYKDTIPNAAGCDSILTINLTVIATPIVTVSTLAGSTQGNTDGTGTSAQFSYPTGVAVDGAGNVYVADQDNHRIRKITTSGVVSTLAGSTYGYTDGTGTSAKFYLPIGIAVDGAGNVYVADRSNHRIRKITASGVVSTLAGSTQGYADGTGTSAKFNVPFGVAVDGAGNVYVADYNNHRIRKITTSGVVSTLAGSTYGYTDGTGTSAQFAYPYGVAVDGAGNVYVADRSNHRIRKITASGVVSTLAGSSQGYTDGTGTSAKFYYPSGVAVDGAGNVYVADRSNNRIRKITASGVVSTLAGIGTPGNADGTGTSAKFYLPTGVAVDGAGNVYVADYVNHRIRKITLSAGSAETTETITANVCDSYTSPSGKTWTTSNTYSDTIPNTAGCDSVITVNLTVRYKSSFSFAETVYETFTSPSGKTWTNSGTYLDTIPNDVNCDSIITVDLTVINKLFVDTDGSSGTGKSWGTSMKNLDDAIKVANATGNHAEIWVRKGMYYPGGQSSSNRDSAFLITNPNVELLGGFAGTETEPGQRNQTANPTILCGDIGTTNDSSDNVYHVLIIAPNGSDIGPNFKLDGLTFKNGNADGNSKYTYENRDVYQSEGGSIVILGSGKSGQEISPTITNCHFEGNYGDYGSIYIRVPNGKSFATISHCTFKNNHSIYGAIFNDGQAGEVSPNIVNCAFDGNTSATSGAAIYNYGYGGKCSPTITSCVFNSNSASSMGGAIYNTGYGGTSNPVITNATFHANAAGSHAGAMYSFGNSGTCQPKVTNSIFYKNTKGGDDGP